MQQSICGLMNNLIRSYSDMYQTIERIISRLPDECYPGDNDWMVQDELRDMMADEQVGSAIASLQLLICSLSQISRTPPPQMDKFFEYFVQWPNEEQNNIWDKQLNRIQELSDNMMDELEEKLYEDDDPDDCG